MKMEDRRIHDRIVSDIVLENMIANEIEKNYWRETHQIVPTGWDDLENQPLNSYTPRIYCQWTFPKQGYHKLNTDGSFNPDSRRGGVGGVVRDQRGNPVLAFSGGVQGVSVIFHELQALMTGLQHCLDIGIKMLEVGSDSEKAIGFLNDNETPPPYCREMVGKIRSLIAKFQSFILYHVYRETNGIADVLAKRAAIGDFVAFIPPFDEKLAHVLQREANGHFYVRVCKSKKTKTKTQKADNVASPCICSPRAFRQLVGQERLYGPTRGNTWRVKKETVALAHPIACT